MTDDRQANIGESYQRLRECYVCYLNRLCRLFEVPQMKKPLANLKIGEGFDAPEVFK